ncbi:MAG: molecular chaperone DnaK [Planctomycetes bacterium]|nr:molecular chaperone DnaK [Planctomycetota bacterium]
MSSRRGSSARGSQVRGRAVGIDLGTTNSCVAVYQRGRAVVIPDEEGRRTTPSALARSPQGAWLVGWKARLAREEGSTCSVISVKRLMGRRLAEVASDAGRVGCPVSERPDLNISIHLGSASFTPQEVSARILLRMKEIAEKGLGGTVTAAVITVPAYFDHQQRRATQDAGRIAGLEVLRIINEPTASAIAYGMDRTGDRKVAVFDLGGGTFDVSILDIRNGVFEVLATGGDTHLGGDDLDWILASHLAKACVAETGIDPLAEAELLPRVIRAAEGAKIELSTAEAATVRLLLGRGSAFETVVTRRELEGLIRATLARTVAICHQVLADARLTGRDLDDLVLVGGATRIPLVRRLAAEVFGREPRGGVDPDEAVAIGAAIHAGMLSGEADGALLLDVLPLSLGVETVGGVFRSIIPRNNKIPVIRGEVFSTAQDNQAAVNVHVLQGERDMAQDNRSLCQFQLTGIEPAPRTVPKIEVTFDVDADGILHVAAENLHTGDAVHVDVNESLALDPEEVERMVETARENWEEDKRRRDHAIAVTDLACLAARARSRLALHRDALPASKRLAIAEALERAEALCSSGDTERILASTDQLYTLCAPLRGAERCEGMVGEPGLVDTREGAAP